MESSQNQSELSTSSSDEGDISSKKPIEAIRPPSKEFKVFLEDLEKIDKPADKLTSTLEFMKKQIQDDKKWNLKLFWEAKKLCLEFFKEQMPPIKRAKLWNDYRELSEEAKRVKDILSEQAEFVLEQTEIAIKKIQEDVQQLVDGKAQLQKLNLPQQSHVIEKNFAAYDNLQSQLNILNTYASRINSLRKEIVNTEMRFRQKNQIFQLLSEVGDIVFPRRKKIIAEISELFIKDITAFIDDNFLKGSRFPFYVLKDEIKALQSIAKILTLNSHAFSITREKLSECWDSVKGIEKAHKKEKEQKISVYKENMEKVEVKISELNEEFSKKTLSMNEMEQKLKELNFFMKNLELGRLEVSTLKERIRELKKQVFGKRDNENSLKERKTKQEREKKDTKLLEVRKEIDFLRENQEKLTNEEIEEQVVQIQESVDNLALSRLEAVKMKDNLDVFIELIVERQEKILKTLSKSDSGYKERGQSLLDLQLKRKNEIKNRISHYRKAQGKSGLDFEEAMFYDELIQKDRTRLDLLEKSMAFLQKSVAC